MLSFAEKILIHLTLDLNMAIFNRINNSQKNLQISVDIEQAWKEEEEEQLESFRLIISLIRKEKKR